MLCRQSLHVQLFYQLRRRRHFHHQPLVGRADLELNRLKENVSREEHQVFM